MASGEASINIRDHGTIVNGKKQRVQCKHCGKEMSGFFRLKCHLGGVRGDVVPCPRAPDDLKELVRSILPERGSRLRKERDQLQQDLPLEMNGCSSTNVAKKSRRRRSESSDSESGHNESTDSVPEDALREISIFPRRRIVSQSAVNGDPEEDPLSKQQKKCIGRFFYATGLDFNLVYSPSFQSMIQCFGQTHSKTPSCQELRGWILKDEVKEMQEHVEKIRQSWTATGCSILLDGWIDEKGRNLVSFIVDCPQGPVYLHSSDVTASIDDVNALQLFLDRVIDEVGVENIVQIIAFSTTGWVADVGKNLQDKYRTVFWTVDASHCIELMLDKIAIMREIRGTLEKAKTISNFIHGHVTVLNLLRFYSSGHDLIIPTKVRSAKPFVTLENMISEKHNLEAMFASHEWNTSQWASTAGGKRVAELVGDPSFWKGAAMVVNTALPIIKALCLINKNDKPQMGFIYETIDQLKEAIREACHSKKRQYMPFWNEIDKIWDGYLHSHLHAAAYFFNPSFFYSTNFQSDPEVTYGLVYCMLRTGQNQPVEDKMLQQLEAYKNSKGAFEEGSNTPERTTIAPARWWSIYGRQTPELQQYVTRILSQTCVGASKYKLNRSLAEKVLTKGRNPIEQQVLTDHAFVHYNLQLQQQHSKFGGEYDIVAYEMDATDEMNAMDEMDPIDVWIVDRTPEIESQNGNSARKESGSAEGAVAGGTPSFQVKEELS